MPIQILGKNDSIVRVLANQSIFELKAKDTNLEIIEMSIIAGKCLFLHPYECENALYLFYILEGEVVSSDDQSVYGPGTTIAAKDLTESVIFNITKDTRFLMVSQKDFFDFQTEYYTIMADEMRKIQAKDKYTEEHCNRTGNLAIQVGKVLGLKEESINALMRASKIHDIGKINTPLEILNKPQSLTDLEFDIIKRHPQEGFGIISGKVTDLESRIVLEHHEKCDGSGYPFGKVKSQICIESRVLAVVDAYDALISERPYRKALNTDEALHLLYNDAGTLWDEEILKALKRIVTPDE